MNRREAWRVAFIAHGARGQKRADGSTPYISHPERVARLTEIFSFECDLRCDNKFKRDDLGDLYQPLEDRIVAAYLHDVLEDTKLTRDDLFSLGCTCRQIDLVERMTKPDKGPAPESYYQRIVENDDALVIKCADRCANLEDALDEVLRANPIEPRRWGRYVDCTYSDVLPMYQFLPGLNYQIRQRLVKIENALPAALQRRADHVAHIRAFSHE